MAESMSKKEKLARGSAVIKVMKVIPRAGHYLKTFLEVHKLPRKPKAPLPRGVPAAFGEMPHLFVRDAKFAMVPNTARVAIQSPLLLKKRGGGGDACKMDFDEDGDGFPDGHPWVDRFGYRKWTYDIFPARDGNLAEHFNILLGLLMSMAKDQENQNFPDIEAYPCVQFLKTILTPDGEMPRNTADLISYLDFICVKMAEES